MGCCWAGVGDEGGGRGCQVLDGGCGGSMQLVLGDFFLSRIISKMVLQRLTSY